MVNYGAAIADFFKTPRWGMNLLFGGLCMLIPIVGPMVLTGWLVTGFWMRDSDDAAQFPPFDFGEFGSYVERGLWPFLVIIVVTMAVMPLFSILMLLPTFGGAFFAHEQTGRYLVAAASLISMALCFLGIVFVTFVMTPVKLRATLTQSFGAAFNPPFIRQFITLTWKEMLVGGLFLMVANLFLMVVGLLVLCVGVYGAAVVNYFAYMHLSKQLYRVYLARGGESVPLNPKLTRA